jgi:hypothetical protein
MTDVGNLHFVNGHGTQTLVPQPSSDLCDPLVHIRLCVSYISLSNGRLELEQEVVEVRCHAHSSLLHSRLRSSGARAHASQSH